METPILSHLLTPNSLSLTAQLAMRKLAKWDNKKERWETLPLPQSITVEFQEDDQFHPVCTEMEEVMKQNGFGAVIFKKDRNRFIISTFYKLQK